MRNTITASVLAASVVLATPSQGGGQGIGGTPAQMEALNEISSELTECTAYYSIGNQCSRSWANAEQMAMLEATQERAAALTMLSAKAAGLSEAAMYARLTLAFRGIGAKIDHSCINISVLLLEYGDTCKQLLEHPEARGQALMQNGGRK